MRKYIVRSLAHRSFWFSATAAHVLVVVLVANLIRSAFGFGEAFMAVPLLALRLRLEVAAPLAVLISITIALIVVVQDRRKSHVRSWRRRSKGRDGDCTGRSCCAVG
jgi:membrane protein implicated in regulation of membrane protease activity